MNPPLYRKLPDGRWQIIDIPPQYLPQEVKIWAMRHDNTFRRIPIDVEQALDVLADEVANGRDQLLLSCHPQGIGNGSFNLDARDGIAHVHDCPRLRRWLAEVVALAAPEAPQ